ncbi:MULTISPECIES: phospho-sugar mutase [Clostridia]|uniref:phospho-sugar mutase n=1 Tax=Clostridia TaxID=186801 RepID=UPI000EA0F88E|nr:MULTISPECIES: phospho-sugar mutase [Clostridia]NBJ69736.1 phospho-sugar mutase [Roseburia sp. 1XD42-34]RKI78101.1 phospho-sugar mutase [Clostridium sp. 1xD42-85]
MMSWERTFEKWNSYQNLELNLKQELTQLKADPVTLEDAFYKELTFGTGGMRGVMGVGTNRMNVYTIRKAVSGLANYLLEHTVNVKDRGVVIAYDSRHMSKEFALETAKVLGAYGITAYVFSSLRPTPLLSFAVRYLGTVSGVMITASHNPPEYNGFKVYNEDGGQITPNQASEIIAYINQVEDELSVPYLEQDELEEHELINWIKDEIDNAYLDKLQGISKWSADEMAKEKTMPIVFTPLHGTASQLVPKGLKQLHFTNVHVVKEQAIADPEFSTVASPNPEEHQAFTMAIEQGKQTNATILLATDPDADRLGVAVKNNAGDYQVLTGNQLGALMLDYLLAHSDKALLRSGRMIKTVVTSELGKAVADYYGIKTLNTLTGFKFIGEKIREFDSTGESFVFGYEESYGYLISSFARDKDAVQASMIACEMAYYWQQQGKTLLDALYELFARHGYYFENTQSITLKGKQGSEKIRMIMDYVRNEPLQNFGGLEVELIEDYLAGTRKLKDGQVENIDLPKENMVKYILEQDCWICLRPSGTEPKLKCYFGVRGTSKADSKHKLATLRASMDKMLQATIEV